MEERDIAKEIISSKVDLTFISGITSKTETTIQKVKTEDNIFEIRITKTTTSKTMLSQISESEEVKPEIFAKEIYEMEIYRINNEHSRKRVHFSTNIINPIQEIDNQIDSLLTTINSYMDDLEGFKVLKQLF